MSPLETLRTALGAIAANKLRAGLTMLGLCIGVAAVIALVAVGNGSKKAGRVLDQRARLQRARRPDPGGRLRAGRRRRRAVSP